MKPSLQAESDEDRYNDEEGLENEATGDGKGITTREMALVMETVDGFQKLGRLWTKVANAGAVIGKHRADGPGQQQGKRD